MPWAALGANGYDLLILDVNLPDGSGLELLYLVRSIAEGQGGYVKVASQVGTGSTFSCIFPESEGLGSLSGGAKGVDAPAGLRLVRVFALNRPLYITKREANGRLYGGVCVIF